MSIQTYYFYQAGSIPNVVGTFSAGTAVDIDTSSMTVMATRPIGSALPTTVLLTTSQATGSTSVTMQSAASGTGVGTALNILGMGTVAFTVTGTFSGTITWEGSEDGTNFFSILAAPYGSSTPATTTTTTGVFIANCAGLQQVRARISAYVSGSITVTSHAVPLTDVLGTNTVQTTSLFTTTQTAQGSGNSGDLTVSTLHEVSIDINLTSFPGGTNPTIQFFWERKSADGIYYVIWPSVVYSTAQAVSLSIGPGLCYGQSLGTTGRFRWVLGGTSTPTATFTPNIIGK